MPGAYPDTALLYSTLFHVVVREPVAAFGTEFRRVSRVLRLPSALVAPVQLLLRRLLRAAVLAEFALVHLAALGTFPTVGRSGRAALGTEVTRGLRTAGAFPC